VFNEEDDDLLDTVHDFSSAMYDNFHHLAPEISRRSGHCAEKNIGFTLYSALCSKDVSYVHIFRATPGQNRSNGLSIQSRFATRAFQTPTTIEIRDFILRLMDDGSAGHRMYM
jgi:hypothetical protein